MSVPALLLHRHAAGGFKVAGLSLLERLIVAAHRAGCHPIQVVATQPLPRFRRLRPLGIVWETLKTAPPLAAPTLVAASDVLLKVDDLRRVIEQQGALETAAGERLPVGLLAPGTVPETAAFANAPGVTGGAACARVTDESSRRAAEAGLWRSLTSSSDGWVDRRFNRPVGRLLSKVLIHTPVTPNQVSLVSILIGIASGWWFAQGTTAAAVIGAILLQVSAVIDCVDGDLARVLFKESKLGRWLDLVGDQFVHLAVFAGLPVGLYRQGVPAPWLWLGASCVIGVVLSFAAVVRGLYWIRKRNNDRLQRFVDATTNRDFSVLLLVLAPLDALDWFVWAAAIGIHLFWITVLGLQFRDTAPAPPSP